MTFNDTFVYLALASSLFITFITFTEWMISNIVISGDIVRFLTKPLDFQINMMVTGLSICTVNVITTSLPTLLLLFFIFSSEISIGLNILFFLPSVILAYFISFHIDYIVGVTAFYTESIWGISMTKEAIVMFLSGVLIPLPFFPESMQTVLAFLPFQAIYNTPLTILISDGFSVHEYISKILIQCGWVAVLYVLSRFYYARAIRVLTVAGG
jgi:ABC-2 type transport system permease protein